MSKRSLNTYGNERLKAFLSFLYSYIVISNISFNVIIWSFLLSIIFSKEFKYRANYRFKNNLLRKIKPMTSRFSFDTFLGKRLFFRIIMTTNWIVSDLLFRCGTISRNFRVVKWHGTDRLGINRYDIPVKKRTPVR